MQQPQIERQQKAGKEGVFRAEATFAKPEIHETNGRGCYHLHETWKQGSTP